MKNSFTIEEARTKHYSEILELIRKEFPYFSLSIEELKQRIVLGRVIIFTASTKASLAGFIEIEFLEGSEARINGLTVKPEFRGQDAAKMLLQHAIGYLKQKNIERIILLVKQSNDTAKALYKQFGFEFIGLYEKKLEGEIVEELELSLIEERPSYAA